MGGGERKNKGKGMMPTSSLTVVEVEELAEGGGVILDVGGDEKFFVDGCGKHVGPFSCQ